MKEEKIEVDYYYAKLTQVKVEYIDKLTGEKLDEEEIKGHEGDPYETEEKQFDQYELIEVPENRKGEMKDKEIVVKYYYQRKAEVEVQYVEKDTEYQLAEKDSIKGYVGDKYQTEALKDEMIQPGEYKEVQIVLRWKKGEENLGQKDNTVMISKLSNPAGYEDIDKEDNTSSSQMLLTVATGLDRNDRIIIIGVVQIVLAITIGGLVSYKKKEK